MNVLDKKNGFDYQSEMQYNQYTLTDGKQKQGPPKWFSCKEKFIYSRFVHPRDAIFFGFHFDEKTFYYFHIH